MQPELDTWKKKLVQSKLLFTIISLCFFLLNTFVAYTQTNSYPRNTIVTKTYPSQKTNAIFRVQHDSVVLQAFRQFIAVKEESVEGEQTSSVVTGTITLDIKSKGTTCGYGNGNIAISASGGTEPYMYAITGYSFQSSGFFPYLSAGTYTIKVKDADGATATGNVTLNNSYSHPSGFVASYNNPSGCSDSDGSVILSAEGGLPPYSFSLDLMNFQSTDTFKNLATGWYNYYVKDANGCTATILGPSIGYCDMGFGFSYSYLVCGNTGTMDIDQPWGGTAPYTFSIDGINYQASGHFKGFGPGILKIYLKDATDKVAVYAIQVLESCPFRVVLNNKNATCGNNDGSITVNVTNGTPPYYYSIDGNNFQSANSFSHLAPGNYTITAKDANGLIAVSAITVTTGCLSLSATTTSTTCDGNNGSIVATAKNGTEPYSYSIDGINFQESNSFKPLAKGNYTVTVKDAVGLTKDTRVTVGSQPGPTETFSFTPATCTSGGTITITAKGGTPPLEYSIDKIFYQSSNVFTNVYQGPYTVTVRDSNKCQFFLCCTYIPDNCLRFSADTKDANCGKNNGSISVKVHNGVSPYTYSIDRVHFQTNNTFSNLGAGTYPVMVKDGNALIDSSIVTINNICITITNTVTKATCGNANGSITLTCTDGTSPYTYSIDGINFQSSSIFNHLKQGRYAVTVKDATGAINTISVDVGNIQGPQLLLTSSAATCSNHDGTITALSTGGTKPVQYSINNSPFQTNGSFIKLDTGTYIITVKDSNACIASQTISVELINNLTIDAGNDVTICEGTSTTLAPSSNGTSFSWQPSATLNNAQIATPIAAPSATTKYCVTASTSICTAKDSVTVFVNPAPVADAGKDSAICFGKDFQLMGSGGVSYTWAPPTYLTSSIISNPIVTKPVHSIKYTLNVVDQNGCKSLQSSDVNVFVTAPAKMFAGNDTSVAFNQPLQLNAVDVNSSGFTQYVWNPSTGLSDPYVKNPIAVVDRDMTYTVTAIAPGGCEGIDDIRVKAYQGPDIYVPTAFTPNQDGRNDFLKATPVGIRQFKYLAIYSRWGQRVFYTSDPVIGWDGKIKGVDQPAETSFVWIVAGIDYKGNLIERRGSVVLIR